MTFLAHHSHSLLCSHCQLHRCRCGQQQSCLPQQCPHMSQALPRHQWCRGTACRHQCLQQGTRGGSSSSNSMAQAHDRLTSLQCDLYQPVAGCALLHHVIIARQQFHRMKARHGMQPDIHKQGQDKAYSSESHSMLPEQHGNINTTKSSALLSTDPQPLCNMVVTDTGNCSVGV